VIPNGVGQAAQFLTSIYTPSTVTLDGSETVSTLIFQSTNAYTLAPGMSGSLILNSGSPTVNANLQDLLGTQTISAPISLSSYAEFYVETPSPTDELLISGSISGAKATIAGTQTTIFGANNTSSLGTIINTSATLQLGDGGTTGSAGSGMITDNGTLAFDYSSQQTFSRVVSGSGGILVNSPTNGGVFLTGSDSYTGGVVIDSGILTPATTNAFGNISLMGTLPSITVNSPGVLDIDGLRNLTFGSVTGNGTIDNLNAGGNITLVLGASGSNDTFSGTIADTTGTVSIFKTGGANLILGGSSTYTGSTYIAQGVIVADATNAIPADSTTYFNSLGGWLNLIMGDNVTISSPITLGSATAESGEFMDYPGSLDTNLASNMVLLSGGGQYRMGVSGTGTLWMTGISSYNTSQFCFLTKGNIAYAGNGGLLVPDTSIGIGRSTNNAVHLYFEGNAVATGTGAVMGEGLSMTNMALDIDNSANFQVTGSFDMEDSTNTVSSGTINLNGGTLGAAYFFQTKNESSPGELYQGPLPPDTPENGT